MGFTSFLRRLNTINFQRLATVRSSHRLEIRKIESHSHNTLLVVIGWWLRRWQSSIRRFLEYVEFSFACVLCTTLYMKFAYVDRLIKLLFTALFY